MAARNYSTVARQTTLTSSVSGGATTFAVTETTGFPTTPFTMVVDPGRAGEEAVTVVGQIGLNLTVLRGQDGTAAQPHDAGAILRHMATARDFREPNEHLNLVEGVHGVSTGLVGLLDAQDIDNKTFIAVSTDHTPLNVRAASGQSAPLVVFSDAAGVPVGSVSIIGRVNTPGVDGTASSTLTAGSAATIPLTVKGAASQTAKLLSIKDSGNNEKASVDANGAIVGSSLTATNVDSTTLTNVSSGTFSTTTNIVPLKARTSSGSSANAFAIENSVGTTKAGVSGDASSYQLFHGDSTNKVPFRVHAGIQSVTMTTGSTTFGGTIDISSYGFTVAPIVQLTIRQNNTSTQKRRVSVNIENAVTTTAIGFRAVQTASDPLDSDETYFVNWTAFQLTPSAAAG